MKSSRTCDEAGAAFHIHAAVGPLGHDLQGLGGAAHDAQAHQPEPGLFNDGFEDRLQMGGGSEDRELLRIAKVFSPRRPCDRHTTCLVVWDGRGFTLGKA